MIEVLVAVPVVLAAVVGLVLQRRRRRPRSRRVVIDSFTLGEPWRHHVSGAQSSQRRFVKTIRDTPDGPLRERLGQIEEQVQRSVEECWQIAKRGDDLDDVLKRFDISGLSAQHDRSTDEVERSSLQRQVDSATRIRTTRDTVDNQLRLLNVRLGELVSQAAEVSVGTDSTAALGTGVDDLVIQLEALRLAAQELQT
jgi:hypothetical protein